VRREPRELLGQLAGRGRQGPLELLVILAQQVVQGRLEQLALQGRLGLLA
jgi:hypothetical protein